MTHLRPEDISIVHRKSSCRRGRHRYGMSQQVGGGIMRQVCLACGSVTIDITGAGEMDAEVKVANRLER
jgi:hypothetical protein